MSTVIKAESLGKKYILHHEQPERYTALRDVIARKAKGVARSMVSPFWRGQPNNGNGKREDLWALRDVSFEIEQGETVGIIGRNGAGKSTLLKILSRITEPTEGRVSLKGRVASLLEVGTGFHPELTGRENIYLNGAILGMTKAEIKSKFDEIVDFAEIKRFLDTPVKRYSSGMYVRLAFAVAAHLEPDILLVDEVLAVGDIHFQKKCMDRMEEVGREGRTILFVSHNLGSVSALCSKCMLLESGRTVLFDSTHSAISRYKSVENKTTSVTIVDAMRNRGNGDIRFDRCLISDLNGRETNSFVIGQDFVIEISMTSYIEGQASLWLIVLDSAGRPLLNSHQRDNDLEYFKKGKYKVVYKTTNLALMPDNYTISAGASDADRNFLEWIDRCQSFEVLPSFSNGTAFDGRLGLVGQTAQWSVEFCE